MEGPWCLGLQPPVAPGHNFCALWDAFPLCVPILKTSAWEPNVPPNDFLIPPICNQEPFDLRHSLIYIFMVLPSSMRSCVLSPPSNANFLGSPTSYPLILPFSNQSSCDKSLHCLPPPHPSLQLVLYPPYGSSGSLRAGLCPRRHVCNPKTQHGA